MELTEKEKLAMAEYAEMAKRHVAEGVAAGSMECLWCSSPVVVNHGDGNAWNAKCECGWSASGIGNFSSALN